MQGFIIQLNRARDEDLVVSILTQENLETLYRFYGARHSPINLGFKVDFEIEHSVKTTIGRLRDVIHLGYPWLRERHRTHLWQQFVKLFYPHLKQSEETGSFYFELLEASALVWHQQNPKRIAIEAYVKLLDYEGRLHTELVCFLCDQKIEEDISLIRAFLPTHKTCSHTLSINQKGLEELYNNHTSLFLSDKEVDRMWLVLLEGL